MNRILRQKTRVCYYEPEEPNFDEYIFCSNCGDYVFEYCSIHGPLLVIPDDKVPSVTGYPLFVPRAALTIPHVFLHLAPSTIPDAEIGVFSTLTLPSGVRFGPYCGIKTATPTPGYSWQIYGGDHKPAYAIDARDANRSNWMRYVNCSRHWAEQNLVAFQYQGQLYYRTIKIIPRCTELLIFYGSEFALSLGVDLGRYNSPEAYAQLTALERGQNFCETNEQDVENVMPTLESNVTKDDSENCKTQNDENIPRTVNPVSENYEKKRVTSANSNDMTENTTYICDLCKKGFKEKAELIVHITTHETKGAMKTNVNINRTCQFSCSTCDFKFATKSELINHDIKIHDSKVNYKACGECDYKTVHNYRLKRHLKVHSGLKPYQCTVCHINLSGSSNLKIHMRIHTGEKPYKCTVCDSRFTHSTALRGHLRIHTGDRPFKCTVCDSRFTHSTTLRRHLKIHSGDKPFKCTVCDSKFTDSSRLQRHLRIHTGDRPFKCTVCESRFTRNTNLKAHLMIHTGDKPFKCTVCESRFIHSNTLRRHLKIHSGDKPFKCTVCDSKFTDSSRLQRHLRIHTGDRPFKCTVIEKTFKDS